MGQIGSAEPDKLVKTHCSFCGMQCGIQLKVRKNKVVGFEPWEEFPFNHGNALPEGREALSAGRASRSAADVRSCAPKSGFAPISYDEALDYDGAAI